MRTLGPAVLFSSCFAPLLLTADPTEPAHELDPVVVTAILPESLSRTPGSGVVLHQDDLERMRPYTLHDAFDFAAGVRTIDDDATGRRSGIGIRGAPARRSRKVLLLEDSSPINAATYLDPSAHYTPPIDRLERVEVLKGAGHLRHGPINNHGVVNFRNVRPTASPETLVRAAAGNLDAAKLHVRHSRTDGPLGSVVAYTHEQADGTFDVEHMRYDDVFVHTDWNAAPGHTLGLSLTYFRERSHYDESNLTPAEYDVAPRRKRGRFGQEHNTFALDLYRAQFVHTFRLPEGGTLGTTAFASLYDRPRLTVEAGESPVNLLPELDPDDPFDPAAGTGQMLGRLRRYRTFGVESVFTSSNDTRADGHVWQGGVRAERQFLDDRRSEGEPGEILTHNNRGTRVRDEAYQATAASVFLLDTWRHGDWAFTVGARAEHYTQSKKRNALPTDPGPHPPREEDQHTLFLPSVSLLYDGFADSEVFASVGRGYAPAIARTAEEFPLRPEIGINSQLGVRTRAVPWLALEAAVFANHISDTIVHMPYTTNDQNVFLNSEDSRSYGLDLALRYRSDADLRPVFEIAYNYTHARFTGGVAGGNDVPEVPRHTGSVTIGIERVNRWHASVTLSHVGAFFTDPANTRGLTLADEDGELLGPGDDFEVREPVVLGRVPSHTLLSARVSVAFRNGRARAWIQGRNLTDKLYIADLENGVRPGAARTILAGVEFYF